MIELVGKELYQWDVGRYVQITGIEAEHAHFANKGDSKAPIMDIADSQAKIPDYLLQTGKQLCVYAVKDGITVESKTFYVQKRERPENYVYEDDRRNYIYELITNAETAIEEAILAAKNANEAADNASGIAFIGSAEGDSIHLDDAASQVLVGLRVFGKTTQDGTPTPDAPVDLVSVVNPTVTVNDQTLLIPYTLHGIPVTSGGNYTDANGQQWICDEVDFARGVNTQRLLRVTGSEVATKIAQVRAHSSGTLYASFAMPGIGNAAVCLSTAYRGSLWSVDDGYFYTLQDTLVVNDNRFSDKNTAIGMLTDENPVFLIAITTPIETPLSAEELAAFAALRTSRGNTTISNDASAHMEIEYVMDAKKYIESIIANHAAPARIAYVNLPASKWVGSGTLYSQVVSIAGITENSQVNLAPSVEQLSIFYEKDITFVTENDGGVVTVYVIGQKPQNDYTIQADIVEVRA